MSELQKNVGLETLVNQKPAIKPIVGWIFIIIYALGTILSTFLPSMGMTLALLAYLATMVFAILLAGVFFGKKWTLVLFVISFVIVAFTENLSVAVGFPFGFFYHVLEKAIPPFIIAIPLIVCISYFYYMMLGWGWANLIIGPDKSHSRWNSLLFRPALAGVAASAIDLTFDPKNATIFQMAIYPGGGGYYGVPLVNSFGWFFTVFVIVFLFELWRELRNRKTGTRAERSAAGWEMQAPVLLGLNALAPICTYIVTLSTNSNLVVKDATGTLWNTVHIYEGMTLVSAHTVVFFTLIAFVVYLNRKRNALKS